MTEQPKPVYAVQMLSWIVGEDRDCTDVFIGVDLPDCRRQLLEYWHEWEQEAIDEGDPDISELSEWDGTDEDWNRLLAEHDTSVLDFPVQVDHLRPLFG